MKRIIIAAAIALLSSQVYASDTIGYRTFEEMTKDMRLLMDRFYSFNTSEEFMRLGFGEGFPRAHRWKNDVLIACDKSRNASREVRLKSHPYDIDDGNLIFIPFNTCSISGNSYGFLKAGRNDSDVKMMGMLKDKILEVTNEINTNN